MKRILFVDDEPNILEGLRNILRKQRSVWEMVFVDNGHKALAELQKASFDIIVSDMRMPGMDGAALLETVKSIHPGVARIVLSGYAERDAVARVLPFAHQYLTKPCDGAMLCRAIDRVCHLQSILSDEKLRNVVGKLDKLPSVPHTYTKLISALKNPETGIHEVARIVESDPAMTMKLLQLSNSSFFGLGKTVNSVSQAVAYLGIELVKNLALTSHVFAAMENTPPIEDFSLELIQNHSLMAARVAKRLLQDPKQAECAFTAGIVHDVGQIVLAICMREEFTDVLNVARNTHRPIYQIEQEMLGFTHGAVGAYLLGVWGLPPVIVEAVTFHHDPAAVPVQFGPAAALYVAEALIGDHTDVPTSTASGIDGALLIHPEWKSELPRWRAIVDEEAGNAAIAMKKENRNVHT